jgi:hypothetical protein
VKRFISRDRSLREYVREIDKLRKIAGEVASRAVLVPMHFFMLDCTRINQVRGRRGCN